MIDVRYPKHILYSKSCKSTPFSAGNGNVSTNLALNFPAEICVSLSSRPIDLDIWIWNELLGYFRLFCPRRWEGPKGVKNATLFEQLVEFRSGTFAGSSVSKTLWETHQNPAGWLCTYGGSEQNCLMYSNAVFLNGPSPIRPTHSKTGQPLGGNFTTPTSSRSIQDSWNANSESVRKREPPYKKVIPRSPGLHFSELEWLMASSNSSWASKQASEPPLSFSHSEDQRKWLENGIEWPEWELKSSEGMILKISPAFF